MPELEERAARWFHEKWGIPIEAYRRSMDNCLSGRTPFPQWYTAVEDGRIIGGLGIIANDFHDRKDLSPNVCAVYTEEDKRCYGIAGSTRCISSRITFPSTNATAGNFSAMFRATANLILRGCTSTAPKPRAVRAVPTQCGKNSEDKRKKERYIFRLRMRGKYLAYPPYCERRIPYGGQAPTPSSRKQTPTRRIFQYLGVPAASSGCPSP